MQNYTRLDQRRRYILPRIAGYGCVLMYPAQCSNTLQYTQRCDWGIIKITDLVTKYVALHLAPYRIAQLYAAKYAKV